MGPHQSALQRSASFKPFVHRQWTSSCWIALFFNYVAVSVSLAVSVLCWTDKNKRRWGPPPFLFLCSVRCNLLNNYWSSPERIPGHVIPLFLWFGFAITTLEKLSETRFCCCCFFGVFCCNQMMMMSWCLMSSDVIWHIRDKLWPMPKHGSIKSTYVRCMHVSCNLPPALLAEWLGFFTCYCGNMGVERIPK